MVDVVVTLYLIGAVILGGIASGLAFYAKKNSIPENKAFLNFYALAVLIMTIGFIVHTLGDFFSILYNSEDLGHIIESTAHVILFISFLLFTLSADKILRVSKQYWFK